MTDLFQKEQEANRFFKAAIVEGLQTLPRGQVINLKEHHYIEDNDEEVFSDRVLIFLEAQQKSIKVLNEFNKLQNICYHNITFYEVP